MQLVFFSSSVAFVEIYSGSTVLRHQEIEKPTISTVMQAHTVVWQVLHQFNYHIADNALRTNCFSNDCLDSVISSGNFCSAMYGLWWYFDETIYGHYGSYWNCPTLHYIYFVLEEAVENWETEAASMNKSGRNALLNIGGRINCEVALFFRNYFVVFLVNLVFEMGDLHFQQS